MAAAVLLVAGCAPRPGTAPHSTTETTPSLAELMRLARKSESGGNLGAAADIYERAVTSYPDAGKARLGLGRTAYALGRTKQAVKAYKAATERLAESADARYGLGKALLADDRPQAAIRAFDKLIAAGEGDHRPYLGKGVALDLQGRHTAAQMAYRAGLKRAPDNTALRNNLGLSLALGGKPKRGIRVLEKLTQDPTAPPRARQNLALVYGLAGRMKEAARVAGQDLSREGVETNLDYYRVLRSLRETATPQTPSTEPAPAPETQSGTAPDDAPAGEPKTLVPDA
ncbi:tetratricopeptide repeat protein [Limimonas halophila]|nr:tetratricopeptide repeat protein [Limimonas halophila]